MSVRKAFGVFYILGGTVFVAINAFMLWNGAQLVGSSPNEKMALGIFGGALAFFIAAQTITMGEFFRPVRLFWIFPLKLPHLSSVALWLLFLAVNLVTGLGTIGHARNASVANAKQQAKTVTNADEDRARYKADLAKLPFARPVDTVEADIDKLRLSKAYTNSDSCANPTTRDQRNTCQQIQALKGEAATARDRARLEAKLDEKGEVITETGPVVEAAAETQVAGVYRALTVVGVIRADANIGSVKDDINTMLSAMWPVALEFGAAYSWHQGFFLLGLSMAAGRRRKPEAEVQGAEANDNDEGASGQPKLISTTQPVPIATKEEMARVRASVDSFLAHYVRPLPGGDTPADEWYDLYKSKCRQRGQPAALFETFVRVAVMKAITVKDVGGRLHFFGVVPRMDDAA